MSVLVNICKYVDFRQTFPKISILVKILKKISVLQKIRFRQICRKISILVKIVWKSWSWSTFSANLDFSQYLRLNLFRTKFYPNLGFRPNFLKISIEVKFCKYVGFGKKNRSPNLDFGQNFRKYQFWWKLSKNLKFGHICRKISFFGQNCLKFSIFILILKNLDFGLDLQKSRIWLKFSKNLHLGQNCRKFLILVKNYQNVDFGHKISMLVKIVRSSRFWSKCTKISNLVKIFKKSRL